MYIYSAQHIARPVDGRPRGGDGDPAFQKVRANSQAMAVMNNLRMLSAAADRVLHREPCRTTTYNLLCTSTSAQLVLRKCKGHNHQQK